LIQIEFITYNGCLVSRTDDGDYMNNTLYDWIYDLVHEHGLIIWIDLVDLNTCSYSCLPSLPCSALNPYAFMDSSSIFNHLDDLRRYFIEQDSRDSYQFSHLSKEEYIVDVEDDDQDKGSASYSSLFTLNCNILGCFPDKPDSPSLSMVESYDESDYDDSYEEARKEKERVDKKIEHLRNTNLVRKKKRNIDILPRIIIGSSSDQDLLNELVSINSARLEDKWNIIADIPFSLAYYMKPFTSQSTLSNSMFSDYGKDLLFAKLNWIAIDLSFFTGYEELLSFIRILPTASTNVKMKRHVIVYAFTIMFDESLIQVTDNDNDIHIIPQFLYNPK
jgi:hypothetical protein